MAKITDYPPGPGINGSEQVLIATPAGPLSTNYTYTMADILAYAGGGGGGSGTVTSVALVAPDIFTVSGSPVTTSGSLTLTAANPGAAADRIVFWDESAGKWTYLTVGTNLTITGTTMDASGGGGVAWGAISGTLTDQTDLNTALGLKAPLASPTLTGIPAAPTAAPGTNTTQIATTAYADAAAGLKITGPGTVVSGRTVTFSGTTGLVVAQASRLEADLVAGPASATSGRIAVYNGAGGKTLQDGTKLEADVVTGPASATTARVATFNGTTGKIIQDGGVLLADLVVGPASVTTGRVASYNGTTGKLIADGGILVADVVTGPASATSGRVATFNGATGKIIQDGGTLLSALATLASPTFTGTPAAPTAAVDTNTTQLATTAFVVAQAGTATPANDGTAAAGTSLRYSRSDHVHSSIVTTTGDILYSSSGVTLARLAIGTTAQCLGVAAGVPAWVDPRATTLTSFSAAYPIVLADANTILLHPSSDTTARTVTIPANASVAFPIGTMITIDNQVSAGVLTIAITTDTLEWVGTGATGSRTVAAAGQCTIMKITSTRWRLSGVGVT